MTKKNIGKGVLSACKPRKEVLEGELDDAIFAADFGQLIEGGAPRVYSHSETFFRNTEPTPDLKAVCAAVFKALADKKEAGRILFHPSPSAPTTPNASRNVIPSIPG